MWVGLSKTKISDKRSIATTAASARLAARATALVTTLFFAVSAHAQVGGGDLFTVENVAVDATAETAAEARGIALAEGNAQAFRRLIARLVPVERQADFPVFEADKIAALIRDFEVDQEKTSRVRYLARLKIRFNRAAVRDALRDSGIPYAETQSKSLVVLPVFRRAGAYLLWDNPNPWREGWSALPATDGLVPIVVPRGGLQDLSFISAEQAVRGDGGRLIAIARRYGAEGALVAIAQPSYNAAQAVRSMQISVRRTNDAQGRTWRNTVAALPGETPEGFMARAARETLEFVREQWKSENLLRFDQQNEIVVTVPLENLGEWVGLRRRLADMAFVSRSDLITLTRRSATVKLLYMGNEEQLRTALAQRDMSLVEGPESWILRYEPKRRRGDPSETARQ